MPDIVDQATRSRMMSGIRGKNTKPELLVRSLLHRRGFRFRLHVKGLQGRPDLVLPRYRVAIMVNGCFWHGHDCRLFKWPGTRVEWWRDKIELNRRNDEINQQALVAAGWRVAVVWECALKGRDRIGPDSVIEQLDQWIRYGESSRLIVRGGADESGNPG